MNENGRFETVRIIRGPDARVRAVDYAWDRFRDFEEVTVQPYRR